MTRSVAGYSRTSGSKAGGPAAQINIATKGGAAAIVDPMTDLVNPLYNDALTELRDTREKLATLAAKSSAKKRRDRRRQRSNLRHGKSRGEPTASEWESQSHFTV